MQLLYQLVVSAIIILTAYLGFGLRDITISIIFIFLFQSLIIVAAGFLGFGFYLFIQLLDGFI